MFRTSTTRSWSALLGAMLCLASCKTAPGTINGSLFTECSFFAGDDVPIGSKRVEMPGIKLIAVGEDGSTSAPAVTDLFGRFNFNDLPGGLYTIRWEEQGGWAAGTHPQRIEVDGQVRHARPVMIEPKQGRAICGHTDLADGTSQYFADEYFGVVSTATVGITDASGGSVLMTPAPVNAMGYFAIPGTTKARTDLLVLTNETLTLQRPFISFAANSGGPVELEQKNHRPQLLDLTPTLNGNTVRTAPAGSVLKVFATAKDPNGDPVTYRWATAPGSGSLSGSGSMIEWTLPGAAGRFTLYALIGDGHGGYDRQTLEFEADKKTDAFSGRLVEKGGTQPIAGAEVTVGGVSAKTDAQGRFSVVAPFQDRFVLNAAKRGFAPLSKVLYSGKTGRTWYMVRAQETTVDPAAGFTIEDKRPLLERQKRRGARIQVPANGLVDQNGKKPGGPLTAYMATINIADGESPGDWGAIGANGKETSLISFGAAWVEFLDATGNKFNLAPGMEAQVEMPAPDQMAPTAPAHAKLWSYDEKDGYWRATGKAAFKPSKKVFVGTVPHFSYVNTDIEKDDPACLRILLYPGIALGQTIRVSFPPGSPFTQTYDIEDCDNPLNAVYRLPANTDVVLTLIDNAGNPVSGIALEEQAGTTLAGNIVNTGLPQGTADWKVPEPYEACKLVIMKFLDVSVNPSLFLTVNQRDLNNPSPANNAAGTEAYYKAIDPQDHRQNLGAWLTENGFLFATPDQSGIPTNAVRTSYMNNNDLGSGRDMYFLKRDDTHIAAYVTNYGKFNQDTANARFAEDRVLAELTATVCMEFSPVEGATDQNPIVKFYVFDKFAPLSAGPSAAPRIPSADLDFFGQKFVPNLCVNCHGAEYYGPVNPLAPSFSDVDVFASFRELDYNTYLFRKGVAAPTAAQRADFKLQNAIVASTGRISSPAIKELIDHWYSPAGSDVQGTTWAPDSYVAAGPQAVALYTGVVAKSCRTCHVALSPDKSWADYQEFKAYAPFYFPGLVLCGDSRRMPHAAVTYRNFWTSTNPHRPALLRDYADLPDWNPLGPCSIP